MGVIDLGPFREAEGYEQARESDVADPLRTHREEVIFTDPELIYLDGNSLGRLHESAAKTIDKVTRAQR